MPDAGTPMVEQRFLQLCSHVLLARPAALVMHGGTPAQCQTACPPGPLEPDVTVNSLAGTPPNHLLALQ